MLSVLSRVEMNISSPLEWQKGNNNTRRRSASGSSMDAYNECYENGTKGSRQMGKKKNERLDVLTGREPAEEMRHSKGQALFFFFFLPEGGSKSTLMLNSSHFGREKKKTHWKAKIKEGKKNA